MVKDALDLAGQIAKKSPVAMAGIKHNLNFSRDHSAQQGLEYMVSTTENLRELRHTVLFVLKSLKRTAPQKNCRSTVGWQSIDRFFQGFVLHNYRQYWRTLPYEDTYQSGNITLWSFKLGKNRGNAKTSPRLLFAVLRLEFYYDSREPEKNALIMTLIRHHFNLETGQS